MSAIKNWSGALALGLCATLLFVLLGEEKEAAAALPDDIIHVDPNSKETLWWLATGVCEAASIWIGPMIFQEEGAVHRQWTLTISDPGTTEPLICLQGVVRIDDAEPFGYQGLNVQLEARPIDGLSWGEVRADAQMSVKLEGLF